MRRFGDSQVRQVFESYPPAVRQRLSGIRELIFATAAATPEVGPLEESLRWGEPAYLTTATRSGTTIRLGWSPRQPTRYALLFHCRTSLVGTFRAWYGDVLQFEGNRALVFEVDDPPPPDEPVAHCIAHALTYHLVRRRQRKAR